MPEYPSTDHAPRPPAALDTHDLESRIEAARARIVASADQPCSSCHGGQIICAYHATKPLGHDGCEGAGMPCPRCYSRPTQRRSH